SAYRCIGVKTTTRQLSNLQNLAHESRGTRHRHGVFGPRCHSGLLEVEVASVPVSPWSCPGAGIFDAYLDLAEPETCRSPVSEAGQWLLLISAGVILPRAPSITLLSSVHF